MGSCGDIPSICEDELGEENKRGHNLDFYTRSMSLIVKDKYGIELCPIVNKNLHSYPKGKTTKDDVFNVVLNTIPVPDESTPWEHILEYRADIDSHNKFLDLRNWMNELARAQLSPMEVEQKLEYLMSQYERHMRLHKMKTNAGTLETVVVSSAEFCEDLVRFKWGKIAKSLFSITHRRIALMEGELTSPGNEVAYIIKAKESFPKK